MIRGVLGPIDAWRVGPPGVQERLYEWGWGHPTWGAWGLGFLLLVFLFWLLVLLGFILGLWWLFAQGKSGPPRPRARHPAPALRPGRDRQGRVRGEEARPHELTGAPRPDRRGAS